VSATNHGACLNPAIALALILSPFQDTKSWGEAFHYAWLYPVFPFVGTLFAILFYEYVYKKAETLIATEEKVDGDSSSSDSGEEDCKLHEEENQYVDTFTAEANVLSLRGG
jgi:hypothetical protein